MIRTLQLSLLGVPQLAQDGVPVTSFVYRKSVALLAYLAVTKRPYGRSTLAGLLWGESTEANALSNLRKVLTDLRRQVGGHLTVTRREVAFDPESLHWLDVGEFRQHIGQALGVVRDPLTRQDATALTDAVALYRGDFLEGLCVRNAPAFEEWVLLEREHLRLLALRALHLLLDYHTSQMDLSRAMDCTDRLLALEPAQEDASRTRMLLLTLSGQRAAALRQYQICRHALSALDAQPDEVTEALYERIRVGTAVGFDREVLAPKRAALSAASLLLVDDCHQEQTVKPHSATSRDSLMTGS